MHLIIAKVDETYFDGEADSMTVPGAAGIMTVLPKHMPLITTLRQGSIVLRIGAETKEFPIDGGILEVRRDGATVVL